MRNFYQKDNIMAHGLWTDEREKGITRKGKKEDLENVRKERIKRKMEKRGYKENGRIERITRKMEEK